jgi:hypothetical protein
LIVLNTTYGYEPPVTDVSKHNREKYLNVRMHNISVSPVVLKRELKRWKFRVLCKLCKLFIIIFSGSAAQSRLWSPVVLQPSAGYGLLWFCSPSQAMASCGSAAQRRLWPPVALQPSAGYGLLWLCSPAQAMTSCGSAAQCRLWPPVALQPIAGYDLLWLCSPAQAMASCGSAAERRLWPPVAL